MDQSQAASFLNPNATL